MNLESYLKKHSTHFRELAGKIGVSPETVRRYLRLERFPRYSVMAKIEIATGGAVRPEDFYAAYKAAHAEPTTTTKRRKP